MSELRLARSASMAQGAGPQADNSQLGSVTPQAPASACEHRAVSRDGRIICKKIADGDPEVTPNVCRECPFKEIDCAHLRFSLRLHSPTPLIVRFNGRTEVWDDGPARLALERAACTERVAPIHGPRACASCPLRRPLRATVAGPRNRLSRVAAGKVVTFPAREAVAAAG